MPDSLNNILPDTIAIETAEISPLKGIILEAAPKEALGEYRGKSLWTESWVMLSLILLFVIVCFRYRNNLKYITTLVNEMVEVRPRSNMFDDTMRETSLLVILNALCVMSLGVLLYIGVLYFGDKQIFEVNPREILLSIGLVLGFFLWQVVSYWIVGKVYSDTTSTNLWLKGFAASQGLLGLVLLPLAVIALVQPDFISIVIYLSLAAYLVARLIFIFKGFRIFFNHISSLLLFLYYLCTLEIVPVVIVCNIAIYK